MAPLTKDSVEVANPVADTTVSRPAAQPAKPAAAGGVRADAVSIEVPVRVYGSRITQVPGQAEPNSEPFEEQTSTMIVFPQGAVLRMSTTVNVGQMLVVTNAKTKADAICRVVKVRTFSNTQGYVEVEFTTAQPKYWDVRFPSDGPAPAAAAPVVPQKSTEVAKAPVAPVAAAPTVQAPKPVAPAPVVAPPVVPAAEQVAPPPKPVVPVAPVAVAPPIAATPVVAPPPVATVEAPAPVAQAPAPVAAAPEVEDEDLETILNRLAPAVSAAPVVGASPVAAAPSVDAIFAAPPVVTPQVNASAPVVAEVAKPEPAIDFPAAPPPVAAPSLTLSELRGDAIAESSGDSSDTEVIEPAALHRAASEAAAEAPRRAFGSFSGGASLTGGASIAAPSLTDVSSAPDVDSAGRTDSSATIGGDYAAAPKQNHFLLIAACIGALAVVVGGGIFYFRTSGVAGNASTSSATTAPATKPAEVEPAGETSEQTALRNTASANNAPSKSAATLAPAVLAEQPANDPNVTITPSITRARAAEANSKAIANVVDASANAHPVAAQHSDAGGPGAAPVLDAPGADANNALGGLVASNDGGASLKAPEVHVDGPLRVGGNVKEPQLISHVMPQYPLTAKEAGIQGDVVIQTTIDQKGNVVNTKVVSGPMMLRGPALDALKRWKYAPSTLNGQPISVSMSVTIKFSNH
jgi:TonB family protein